MRIRRHEETKDEKINQKKADMAIKPGKSNFKAKTSNKDEKHPI